MNPDDIVSQLQEIFRSVLNDPSVVISRSMTADDHEAWDSLSHINLVMEVERVFKIRIRNSEVARLANVGDLIDLIGRKLG